MAAVKKTRLINLFAPEDETEVTVRIRRILNGIYADEGIKSGNQLFERCKAAGDSSRMGNQIAGEAYYTPESMTIGTLQKLANAFGKDFDSLMSMILYDMELHPQGIGASYGNQRVVLKSLCDKFLRLSPDRQTDILLMISNLPDAPIGTDHANASLALRHQVRDALDNMQYPYEL